MTKDELMALPHDTLITTTLFAGTIQHLEDFRPAIAYDLRANAHVADTPTLPFSWADAPTWAQYAAQDESGAWFFYKERPTLGLSFWNPTSSPYQSVKVPHWQQSLTQRPVKHPTLAQEFPNFSEQGLDKVFPGWTPTHNHNDVSPSYELPIDSSTIVKLWVHDRDRSKREEDSYERFLIEVRKDEWQIVCFSDENMTGLMSKMSWYLVTRGSDVQAVLQMNLIELARAVGLVATK